MSQSTMAVARQAVLDLADREPQLAPYIKHILTVADDGQVVGLNVRERKQLEAHISYVVAMAVPARDPEMDDRRCALEGIFRHACAGVL